MLRAMTVLAGALVIVGTACGGDSGPVMSEAAAAGRSVFISNGCAACHGSAAGGGVGPALIGLIGSKREFADGSSLIADRNYAIESIMDPSAKIVSGYSIPMPMNNLSREQVESIVDYLEEVAAP